MTTQFPSDIDDLSTGRGSTGDTLASPDHSQHHADEDDAIQALETKIGVDGSADTDSLDYKLKSSSSVDPGHKHTSASVTLGLSDLDDTDISSPSDGNGIFYDADAGKWKNSNSSVADASSTVIGVAKLSLDPASPTEPIAVGDNDSRFNTHSGTALSGSNKVIDEDSVGTSGANKILELDGSGKLPAVDGSQLTGLLPGLAAGQSTPYSTTSLTTSDETITTGFQPRLIRLYYFIQGFTGSAGTDVYCGMKGIAIFNGTTLIANIPIWVSPKLSGDNGTPADVGVQSDFVPEVNDTSGLAIGATSNNGIYMTLSINSVSSTGFVIRKVTTGTAGATARANCTYEAFA